MRAKQMAEVLVGEAGGWRTILAKLFAVAGMAVVTGCAMASEPRAAMSPPTPAVVVATPAPPAPPGSYASNGEPSLAPRATEAAPENRPGLGTEWGEARESPIEDVAFHRADETRPIAMTELRYDDERGVEGLAAYVADRGHRGHESSAAGGAIAIYLKDGHDNPLDVVQVAGHTFVVGEAGDRYTIVLENRTGHRFETVTTVDGLDVINGKSGALRNRGYLLMPHATLEIDGFRQTEQTVAAFRFGRVKDSYAAKVGPARDVGVIGMAFFSERGDSWTPFESDEVVRRATAHPFPGDGPRDDRFAPPPRW